MSQPNDLERTMELTLARTSFCPLHSSTRLFLWRLGGHVILNDPGTACIALVDCLARRL
ncbi:predicted protein [Botrytis cinerea T4]|uniref:Uncharacterized protein n=1 Tax=Botryotinia fuckeliana (strain T4) TaxID=999810 RepID=G2YW13_BOTF4|nr:predicted protein [Botrytis cinerea T4]